MGASTRDSRTQSKLTQEKLVERASLSKNYIGNIERGEYDVTVSTLHRVVATLGITAGNLLKAAGI